MCRNAHRFKRWVVVRPPGAATGLLLARADGEDQAAIVGKQVAGRVGFFLSAEDFHAAYARMASAGVACAENLIHPGGSGYSVSAQAARANQVELVVHGITRVRSSGRCRPGSRRSSGAGIGIAGRGAQQL